MKKYPILALALTLALTSCSSGAGSTPSRSFAELSDSDRPTPPDPVYIDTMETEPPETTADTEPIIPEVPKETRVSFLAAGDNVIHPCIYIDAKRRATESTRPYNFRPMYDDVDEFIASFDLSFINQETLMGGDKLGFSGYPTFNSPQDLGRDLRDIGFDIVNIANNHMCDKGEAGLVGTIDFWESEEMSGVTMIGGYRDKDDYDSIRIVESKGIKIAFLSYTYGTNGLYLPKSSKLVVPYINDNDIKRQCALANEVADMTIVSIHWGVENSSTVSSSQKRVAKLLSDNGVDVILGHHPHVLQPIEYIEGKDGNKTLCIYSLGNLVSAMMYWENMVGGFFTFDIVKDPEGEISIESPEFVPTAFFYGPSYYESHLYFLSEYPDDVAKNHGTGTLYGSPAKPADMRRYAAKAMGDYLSSYPSTDK